MLSNYNEMQIQKQVLQIEGITSNALLNEVENLLKNAFSTIATPQPETEFITRQHVADLFGISLPTVHSWMNTGILTAYKIGNKTRFKKCEVLAACKPQKQTANQ